MVETWANKRPKLTANPTLDFATADKDQVMETDKSEALAEGQAEAANDKEDDAAELQKLLRASVRSAPANENKDTE